VLLFHFSKIAVRALELLAPTLAQSSSFDCAVAIDCAALLLISSLANIELPDTLTNGLA
jgi:hypothetical protein